MSVTQEDWLAAQCSVLGSALIEPGLVPKIMTETAERDFSGPARAVYNAMRKLFLSGSSVDVVSVAHELGQGYREYLKQLMDITPSAANIDHYIALCREQSRILQIRDSGQQLATASSMEQISKILEQATGLMVDKPTLRIVTMSDALRSFMERHTAEAKYLNWPVSELDSRLYAELGDFIVMGGYPSTGKSSWALQCAWHWAKEYRVGFFSLETSSEKLFDRQMASVANISMDNIKRNDISDSDWERLCNMTQMITGRSLELIPAAGMSVADVRAVTMMRGYQIVIVDYLQLLQATGGNRTEQVTAISIGLHTLAQSLGVTVVALSQLARQSKDSPKDARALLRESGQIDQDADIIMILSLEKKDKTDGNRILDIQKNKEGTCPYIVLAFDGKHQTFSKAKEDVLGKLVQEGKRAKRNRREEASFQQQWVDLPMDTKTPFGDDVS